MPTLWFRKHLVMERADATVAAKAISDTTIRTSHPAVGTHTYCSVTVRRRSCSLKMNPTPRACGVSPEWICLRERRIPQISHCRRSRRRKSLLRRKDKAAALLSAWRCPASGTEVVSLRLGRTRARSRSANASTGCSPCVWRRRMTSMTASHRAHSPRTSGACIARAIAGMLWSKQYYFYDVDCWLKRP